MSLKEKFRWARPCGNLFQREIIDNYYNVMDDAESNEKKKKSVHFIRSGSDEQQLFNTSKIALTPSLKKIKPVFIKPEQRSAECVAPPSSITCPNYEGISRLNVIVAK